MNPSPDKEVNAIVVYVPEGVPVEIRTIPMPATTDTTTQKTDARQLTDAKPVVKSKRPPMTPKERQAKRRARLKAEKSLQRHENRHADRHENVTLRDENVTKRDGFVTGGEGVGVFGFDASPSEKSPQNQAENTKTSTNESTNGASRHAVTPSRSVTKKRDAFVTPGFLAFWQVYPRKVAKLAALKAWAKVGAEDHAPAIVASVQAWSASEDWTKDGGQFVPHAATWLNGRRWEDDPPRKAHQADNAATRVGNALLKLSGGAA